MLTSQQILQEAKDLSGYMTGLRRDIHAHPELGRQETRTQALILRELAAMDESYRPDLEENHEETKKHGPH